MFLDLSRHSLAADGPASMSEIFLSSRGSCAPSVVKDGMVAVAGMGMKRKTMENDGEGNGRGLWLEVRWAFLDHASYHRFSRKREEFD